MKSNELMNRLFEQGFKKVSETQDRLVVVREECTLFRVCIGWAEDYNKIEGMNALIKAFRDYGVKWYGKQIIDVQRWGVAVLNDWDERGLSGSIDVLRTRLNGLERFLNLCNLIGLRLLRYTDEAEYGDWCIESSDKRASFRRNWRKWRFWFEVPSRCLVQSSEAPGWNEDYILKNIFELMLEGLYNGVGCFGELIENRVDLEVYYKELSLEEFKKVLGAINRVDDIGDKEEGE